MVLHILQDALKFFILPKQWQYFLSDWIFDVEAVPFSFIIARRSMLLLERFLNTKTVSGTIKCSNERFRK